MSEEPRAPKPGPERRRKVRSARPRQPAEPRREDLQEFDRGVRALVGSAPSQLSKSTAMRVRDIDRPSPAELDDAERTTEIINRHWQPPS